MFEADCKGVRILLTVIYMYFCIHRSIAFPTMLKRDMGL